MFKKLPGGGALHCDRLWALGPLGSHGDLIRGRKYDFRTQEMCRVETEDMCDIEKQHMCYLESPDMCCLERPDMCCLENHMCAVLSNRSLLC